MSLAIVKKRTLFLWILLLLLSVTHQAMTVEWDLSEDIFQKGNDSVSQQSDDLLQSKRKKRRREHTPSEADCKYALAVCSIFQNEAAYLPEWIEFHKLVGVQRTGGLMA